MFSPFPTVHSCLKNNTNNPPPSPPPKKPQNKPQTPAQEFVLLVLSDLPDSLIKSGFLIILTLEEILSIAHFGGVAQETEPKGYVRFSKTSLSFDMHSWTLRVVHVGLFDGVTVPQGLALLPAISFLLGLCCSTSSHVDNCSSSLHSVASTCALCQCWVVVFACGGRCMLCVYMCTCVWYLKLSFVYLSKSCLWPSFIAWMEGDLIALMLWTNSCAEFDAIFFISYCFPFSVLLCCNLILFILTIVSTCILWL